MIAELDGPYHVTRGDSVRRIQDWMTITEGAEFLGVSARTLRSWERA